MIVELDEMKNYLRVDHEDDDSLIGKLITSAEAICLDVSRCGSIEEFSEAENAKIAVLYATAYLYEHREEADHHDLLLTLRSLLFAVREGRP